MKIVTKGLLAAAAVIVAGALLVLPSYGQGRPGFAHGPGMMAGGPMGLRMLLHGANLTADQKTQVQQIMANHRPNFQNLFSQLRTAQDQLSNQFLSPGALNEADLAPQLQQVASIRSQIADESLKAALEVRNILTPDQLTNAAQLKSQMENLRSQMRNLQNQGTTTQQ
jgi:Spy/CpxP family protein refolding chaperone